MSLEVTFPTRNVRQHPVKSNSKVISFTQMMDDDDVDDDDDDDVDDDTVLGSKS